MSSVTIVFPERFGRGNCLARLTKADSGFRVDSRPPLDSGVEVGIAIAGLVVGVAQLAVAILDLRRSSAASKAESKPEVITIVWPDGRRKSVPSDDEVALKAALQSPQTDSGPGPSP